MIKNKTEFFQAETGTITSIFVPFLKNEKVKRRTKSEYAIFGPYQARRETLATKVDSTTTRPLQDA